MIKESLCDSFTDHEEQTLVTMQILMQRVSFEREMEGNLAIESGSDLTNSSTGVAWYKMEQGATSQEMKVEAVLGSHGEHGMDSPLISRRPS